MYIVISGSMTITSERWSSYGDVIGKLSSPSIYFMSSHNMCVYIDGVYVLWTALFLFHPKLT